MRDELGQTPQAHGLGVGTGSRADRKSGKRTGSQVDGQEVGMERKSERWREHQRQEIRERKWERTGSHTRKLGNEVIDGKSGATGSEDRKSRMGNRQQGSQRVTRCTQEAAVRTTESVRTPDEVTGPQREVATPLMETHPPTQEVPVPPKQVPLPIQKVPAPPQEVPFPHRKCTLPSCILVLMAWRRCWMTLTSSSHSSANLASWREALSCGGERMFHPDHPH